MPRICIGVPVFNGDRYLESALDALLQQTFDDFRIDVLDNASTDGTQEICEAYTRRDGRVRYHRNETNIGAAPNFNRVFDFADAEYFKWAAHDDLCAPEFLQSCIDVLDADDSVILAYPKTTEIDDRGDRIRDYDFELDGLSDKPHVRFRRQIIGHNCHEVFGVFRTKALKETPLIGRYPGGDAAMLLELCLRGKFHQIPDRLLSARQHDTQSRRMRGNPRAYANWFDTGLRGQRVLPYWRLWSEYRRIIREAALTPRERCCCYGSLANWVRKRTRLLSRDVVHAVAAGLSTRAAGKESVSTNKALTTR